MIADTVVWSPWLAAVATIFIVVMQHTVQEVLKTYPADTMRDGDVFIVNDPYRGGTHTMDVKFVRPYFRDGELLGPDDLRRVDPLLGPGLQRFEDHLASIAAGIVDPADPLSHPEAARYVAQSIAEFVDSLDLSELTRLFVTRNMQGEFAAEPREVSVLFVAQQRAVYERAAARHGHVEACRLLGGVSAIADGLAAALPPGTVRLDRAVSAVVPA